MGLGGGGGGVTRGDLGRRWSCDHTRLGGGD